MSPGRKVKGWWDVWPTMELNDDLVKTIISFHRTKKLSVYTMYSVLDLYCKKNIIFCYSYMHAVKKPNHEICKHYVISSFCIMLKATVTYHISKSGSLRVLESLDIVNLCSLTFSCNSTTCVVTLSGAFPGTLSISNSCFFFLESL